MVAITVKLTLLGKPARLGWKYVRTDEREEGLGAGDCQYQRQY